ncbi:MAG: hypothetical protein V7713_06115 [Marinobacter sp.]|uniref:hypothetical protein n=1 Tax=Marinobacter sp. AC-23 TaxID=1879031 RepID=UPI0008DD0E73|nr:hypothetical protein [Marinobacter sp. AC-23]OHY81473.1 hypothetical protein BCA33_11315 [Marinobacter sp. AC-23]
MTDTLLANESLIRLGFFLSVLTVMAAWEAIAARHPQRISRLTRWPNNLLIVVLDTLAVRLVFPLAAVGAAYMASKNGWGLLNLVSL